MGRWVVFDQDSLEVVVEAGAETAELRSGDALEAALGTEPGAVVLMPASGGRVLAARIRHTPPAPATIVERGPVYEAAGFLGLRDEPVYEDEPAPPKKWWQKILD